MLYIEWRKAPRVNEQPHTPAPSTTTLADQTDALSPGIGAVSVGDVLIRRDESGYGIFNYRGERVLELPLRTPAEAVRLAAEIVSPWHGRVRIDERSKD